jgi:hypothetical protein
MAWWRCTDIYTTKYNPASGVVILHWSCSETDLLGNLPLGGSSTLLVQVKGCPISAVLLSRKKNNTSKQSNEWFSVEPSIPPVHWSYQQYKLLYTDPCQTNISSMIKVISHVNSLKSSGIAHWSSYQARKHQKQVLKVLAMQPFIYNTQCRFSPDALLYLIRRAKTPLSKTGRSFFKGTCWIWSFVAPFIETCDKSMLKSCELQDLVRTALHE